MKMSGFILFLTIVLLIYTAVNAYILWRHWASLNALNSWRWLVVLFLFLWILAYPAGRFLESVDRNLLTNALIWAGSFYLGVMVYVFLGTVLLDLLKLVDRLFHFLPDKTHNPTSLTLRGSLAVWGTAIVLIVIGYLNAAHPVVRHLEIHIPKSAGKIKQLKIALASDIHLGTLIRNSRLEKIVDKINALEPDIILLAGDIVDEDVAPVMEQNMAQVLQKLRAQLGVYAITGNHEYFGGVRRAIEYIQESRITMLVDTVVKVDDGFYLVGRRDMVSVRFGEKRKPLDEILEDVDRSLPIILMDHQPFRLEEAEENGVDLQLSGHTHHGQLFPFNWITRRVYEVSWGYHRRGNTQYYVSCGVGTWGPPVRLGSRPEIVELVVRFGE